jgi:protein-disulfide isomerase
VLVTRRNAIILGTGIAVLAVGGATLFWNGNSGGTVAALADTVPTDELMKPGPLGDEAMGSDKAPVTIVEYASMTCPHCARFATEVFPEIKQKYIDTGKVRYIFREFPLDRYAAAASMLARCADNDKFFPMIEVLFRQQSKWAVAEGVKEQLLIIAKQAGFTQSSFDACLANQKILDGIEWVRARGAEKFKVNATPTFFINGEMHRGEMTLDEIEKAIQPYLKA